MGLLLLVGKTADGLKWAHFCQSEKLPMALNGPIASGVQTADGLEWAQCFSQDMLLMALDGPISASQRNC
jgi:hypothetical protein